MNTDKDTLCGRCRQRISPKKYPKAPTCSGCTQLFHSNCSSIAAKTWSSFSPKEKKAWVCVDCRGTSGNSLLSLSANTVYTEDSDTEYTQAGESGKRFRSSSNSSTGSKRSKGNNMTPSPVTMEAIGSLLDEKLSIILNALEARATQQDEKIKILSEENQLLKKEVERLTLENENHAQYTRKNNVIIHNIPLVKGEEQLTTAVKLFNAIGLPFTENEVDACHRLPTRNQKNPPPFLIKFVSRHRKVQMIQKIKSTKPTADVIGGNKEDMIFASDHLTRQNGILLQTAKQKLKPLGYTVSTLDSSVYAYKMLYPHTANEKLHRTKITSAIQIDEILKHQPAPMNC